MKISEYLILSIAVILITLGIANLDNLLNVAILVGTAFCIIMYVIITVISKKRLERELWLSRDVRDTTVSTLKMQNVSRINEREEYKKQIEQLEIDLANQVNATNECECKINNLVKLHSNDEDTNYIPYGLHELDINTITNNKLTKLSKLPFTEEIKQCEKCGTDMNKRTKYWVCPNCLSRKKIEE